MREKRLWTMRDMLAWCEGYLSRHNDEHARLSAEWLIAHALGKDRIELYLDLDRPFTPDELDCLRDYVKRRAGGEPLQYIVGTAAFRYIELAVRPGVLIPRPETEVLVSVVLDYIDSLDAPSVRVCEIGTGSGCIACSLASERERCVVDACDISPDACEVAQENATALELGDRVSVTLDDMAQNLVREQQGSYDVVVSNPPYIPTRVYEGLSAEVRDFEPRIALESGEDGLDAFRRLATAAYALLKAGGLLAVELFEGHLEQARAIACEAGFVDAKIEVDLAGKPRILRCYRKEG